MTYNEVITRLCILRSKVMRKVFNCDYAADCICDGDSRGFRSEEPVMAWIEHAVNECIELHANGFVVECHFVTWHPTSARTIPLQAFVSRERALDYIGRQREVDKAIGEGPYDYGIRVLSVDLTSGGHWKT